MAGPDQLSAEAAAEWIRHAEGILRGVGHALNNRAASVGALVELADHGPDDVRSARALAADEAQRLAALAAAIRAIGETDAPAQAFTAEDAARDAAIVLSLHRDFRGAPPAIEAEGAPALRTRRGIFVRALVALAGGLTTTGSGASPIAVREEGDWLIASARGVTGAVSPLVAELARAMQGEALEGSYGFRVPTLALLRRREGR